MSPSVLRRAVRNARRHEQHSGLLRAWLAWRRPELTSALRIACREPLNALWQFSNDYVGQLPDYFDTTRRLAHDLGATEVAQPLLKLAADCFVHAGDVAARPSLLDLFHVAYLSHRLIEEVNDHCIARLGGPPLPHATTLANLVSHHLLGEGVANALDDEVQQAAERWLVGRPLPAVATARRCTADWPSAPLSVTLAWPSGGHPSH